MKLLWLMLAGALGAAARYGLTLWIDGWLEGRGAGSVVGTILGAKFPLATLFINVSGTLLLSFLVTLALHGAIKPEMRLILGTGFLGAFTTFSTFELEAESLLTKSDWLAASVYIGGNLIGGFAAIFIGRALALRVLALFGGAA